MCLKRNIRRHIDAGLTGVGIAVVFSSIILGTSLDIRAQMPIALLGVLLMEAGIWGLASRFVPNQRKYTKLRGEGDNMLHLIRELNAAAIAKERGEEDSKRFQETLAAMHDSVIKMSGLANVDKDLEKGKEA
ncbi:MAG: hypothetical protein ACI95C_002042 [Pseudohongiellaceae bacterium]